MSSNIDSVAVFLQRAADVGANAEEIGVLNAKGWNTMGKFAFACDYTPGESDKSPLVHLAKVITQTTSGDVPDDRMPVIRRLFYEAYTLYSSEMKDRVDRRDEDQPRKLAGPERQYRRKEQSLRLSGLELRGELEPSHALVDLVQSMADENTLKYVRWEQCSKREQEIMGIRLDPIWRPDARGVVRETFETEALRADTSTDLLLSNALRRRSLAFDQCNLCRYDTMEAWSTTLMNAYMRSPPRGFKRVSLEQLQAADIELFRCLMEATGDGIRPTADGRQPIQDLLPELTKSSEVRLFLMPLQSAGGGLDQGGNGASKRKTDNDDQGDRFSKVLARIEGRLQKIEGRGGNSGGGGSSSSSSGKNKGKGKGKNKGKNGKFFQMPAELRSLKPSGPNGRGRCFAFNLEGCSSAEPGGSCEKGEHVCMRCGGNHSQRNCPKK